MNHRFTPILIASLLCSSAFVVPAFSQETADPAQLQGCEGLTQVMAENSAQLRPEWVEQANAAVTAADEATCTTLLDQVRGELETAAQAQPEGQEGQTTAQTEAQIVVTQPTPEVTVQQTPPEIVVTQPQPQVLVNQGQPQILVRQAPPTVNVQIPQPVITIDQPPPEIIITMPEPEVGITQAEPQVEVRMAQPQVTVEQAQPEVQVEATPESTAQPEVQVQQGQATVVQQQAEGEPQIEVQRQEPTVQFEAAEPVINVESGGEPQVQFNQSGEPTITIQEAGEQPAEGQQLTEQPEGAAPEDQAQAQPTPEQDAMLLATGEPVEPGEPAAYPANALMGQPLVNAQGQNLGNVDLFVSQGDQVYAVLSPDSPLSPGGDQRVVLPVQSLSLIGNQLTFRGLSNEELTQLRQTYDAAADVEVPADQEIQVSTR